MSATRDHGSFRMHRQRGAAAAEFSVLLPFLTLAMLGLIDFGRVWVQSTAVQQAAHAGAQYGAQTSAHAGDASGIEQTVMNDLNASAVSEETYSVDSEQYCQCASGSPIDCDDTCSTGARHMYVRVLVNSNFQTLFDYPGIPHVINVSREARLRAR